MTLNGTDKFDIGNGKYRIGTGHPSWNSLTGGVKKETGNPIGIDGQGVKKGTGQHTWGSIYEGEEVRKRHFGGGVFSK